MDSHRPGRRPGQSRPARAARWVGLSSATGSHRSSLEEDFKFPTCHATYSEKLYNLYNCTMCPGLK